jgi:hypothetical protein
MGRIGDLRGGIFRQDQTFGERDLFVERGTIGSEIQASTMTVGSLGLARARSNLLSIASRR